jgi:2-C-methyl-D-erythritol 2,4-cyclodiphosphate synthase
VNLRIAMGYDIHRLVAGRPLHLGGVEIPYEKGLLGHSDGDAAAHALADALLGAARLGDLGMHFPDDDPTWKGVSGVDLLERTRELLEPRGMEVVQADLTILAEAPRLAPYRDAMRAALSGALRCDPDAISIKSRTNEGLGAIGRGEAIAVYAVVLVRRRET